MVTFREWLAQRNLKEMATPQQYQAAVAGGLELPAGTDVNTIANQLGMKLPSVLAAAMKNTQLMQKITAAQKTPGQPQPINATPPAVGVGAVGMTGT